MDHDGVYVAVLLEHQLLAQAAQLLQNLVGDPFLILDSIGKPLMVNPGRRDGGLDFHSVIDDVRDGLEHCRDDPPRAGGTEDQKTVSILGDDGGGLGANHALARFDAVGLSRL